MDEAFFDNQNKTYLLPEVVACMRPFWSDFHCPPSALHRYGIKSRDAVSLARVQVASLLNASEEEIHFTSGATESANLAIKGVAWANRRIGNHIVASSIEHPSVRESLVFLEQQGFSVSLVPVDRCGFIDPDALANAIREETILVCLHHANHDIGTVQSVKSLIEVATSAGVPTFVDASTSGGWLEIDVKDWGASLVSLAPHRFHGPLGVGILYRNSRARIQSLIHGGNQENGLRAGTENVPSIVGAGVAAEIAARALDKRGLRVGKLQAALWDGIERSIPDVVLHGPELGDGRLRTNLNFSVAGLDGEGLVLMCDVQGISLATGTSCISKTLKGSPVLEAIGVPRKIAQGNVILTLGDTTKETEVDYFLGKFPGIVRKLRSMSPAW